MQARFDKQGNRLPDTGHGCGCQLCADANAPRYERRRTERTSAWSPLRRRLVQVLGAIIPNRRPEPAA
ncbi:MAG: hypothetical protein E6I58_00695 [Chloroflexi bacterium]|nr:MAG: hypothetical protein E6J05_03840 [Chloroflexota bacterium]TME59010.1 MAG: hypothetical protein E6I58_00695 [Chloroflexota bacterium]